jgi:hypothetical protein
MTQAKNGYLVMELSFIGWYVLCAFTSAIVFFFLMPYIEASRAGSMKSCVKSPCLGFSDSRAAGYWPGHIKSHGIGFSVPSIIKIPAFRGAHFL